MRFVSAERDEPAMAVAGFLLGHFRENCVSGEDRSYTNHRHSLNPNRRGRFFDFGRNSEFHPPGSTSRSATYFRTAAADPCFRTSSPMPSIERKENRRNE